MEGRIQERKMRRLLDSLILIISITVVIEGEGAEEEIEEGEEIRIMGEEKDIREEDIRREVMGKRSKGDIRLLKANMDSMIRIISRRILINNIRRKEEEEEDINQAMEGIKEGEVIKREVVKGEEEDMEMGVKVAMGEEATGEVEEVVVAMVVMVATVVTGVMEAKAETDTKEQIMRQMMKSDKFVYRWNSNEFMHICYVNSK
jgi:hypothetical protein